MITVEEVMGKIQKNFVNIAVIGVCLIIAFKIFSAQTKKIDGIRAEAAVETQKAAILQEISGFEGRLKTLGRQINIKDDAAVINTLNEIAKSCGVKILVLKPVPKQAITGYTRCPYSLNIAVDNYHTLGKFVSALESHPFVFSIDSMNVTTDPGAESKRYKMMVTLEVSTILIKDKD
jgi:Tfp pilus assembly protein PilO